MLSQLVCSLWHDVLINRVPDCLPSCLGPVENVLKTQVKPGKQFSFVPYLLTCSKSANRLKWVLQMPFQSPWYVCNFQIFCHSSLAFVAGNQHSLLCFPKHLFQCCCNICHPLILLRADTSQAEYFLLQLSNFILTFIQTTRCTV